MKEITREVDEIIQKRGFTGTDVIINCNNERDRYSDAIIKLNLIMAYCEDRQLFIGESNDSVNSILIYRVQNLVNNVYKGKLVPLIEVPSLEINVKEYINGMISTYFSWRKSNPYRSMV